MGIKMVTSESSIRVFLDRAIKTSQQCILTALSKLGEECVVRIRNRPSKSSWIDHTGNLRSSIGYAVYDNGRKFLSSSFEKLISGIEGSVKGKKMIENLAKEYSKTYALVVVAAMDYAAEVEALESKDVLSSTKTWALSVVEQRIKTALEKAIKEINTWKL